MTRNELRVTTSIALALTFLLGACAKGPRLHHRHEFTLSPGQEHHAGLATAILFPIDSSNEKRLKGLDVANDRIEALVIAHLESKGIKITKVDAPRFEQALEEAYETERRERLSGQASVVSSEVELADVVPAVLEELEMSADLVVVVGIVMRNAVYQGTRTLVWDGVRRREKVMDLDFSEYDAPVPAASIHATVFTKDGTQAFSGFGGLESVFRVDVAAEDFVIRKDLFKDERNLREGICISFYPYFGMDEVCRR